MTFKYDDAPRDRSMQNSRYRGLRVITDLDTKKKFLETWERKEIPARPDDFYHTVQPHEEFRLDKLAFDYYKNATLWWVIAQSNDISNPMEYPKTGDIVRIPSINTLYGNGGLLL